MTSGGFFDFDAKSARLAEVDRLVEDPALWDDPKRAQEIGREKKSLETVVGAISGLTKDIAEGIELLEMAREEGDDATLLAVEQDAHSIEEKVAGLEFRRMFSNPADPSNCFLDIQAGAGGTEACDWASILLRQYLRYAERKGFKAELLEESAGDVAGIKSATIKVNGDYARPVYTGWCANLLSIPAGGGTPHSHRYLSIRRLMTHLRLISIPQMCGPIPTGPRVPGVSTLTRPTLRFASPTFRLESLFSARMIDLNIATGMKHGRC